MRILVVEDQDRFLSFIRKGLEEQGMAVDAVNNGDDGYALASSTPYDLIVLDIMLPGQDGLSILKQLRQSGDNVPVILLTARSSLEDRLEGLNLGADDYLPKPFYIEELVARIQTVVRRANGQGSNILRVDDLVMNLSSREVTRGDELIDLTIREFALLEYLMRSPGRVISRTQICEHVWNYDFDPGTNLVDVYVRRLRNKLDANREEQLIQTVRGIGYRLGAAKAVN